MGPGQNSETVLVHPAGVGIFLLGGFSVRAGSRTMDMPPACQRLLAFLALGGQGFRRAAVAGSLWPDSSEVRAHASLRAALARLHKSMTGLVRSSATEVAVAEGVGVDLDRARRMAYALLEPPAGALQPETARASVAVLSTELLPGWYDDWILLEAENWRQLRLHALESLARSLATAGHFGDATAAALAAVAADPLRESAHAALIGVHLAEGNRSEALRSFAQYRALLRRELGIEPTARLHDLMR